MVHCTLIRGALFALLAIVAWPHSLTAQVGTSSHLTLDDIYLKGTFAQSLFTGGRWAESGPVVFSIEANRNGGTNIVAFDLETSTKSLLVDGSTLRATDVDRIIWIDDYAFSPDDTKVLLYTDSERVWRLNTKGYYYILDRESGDLTALSDRELGFQMFAKFSPDGKNVGFVRQRNLYVVNLDTGVESRLTRDGSSGGVINGTSDWVYEEEFGLRDAWHWSPDGSYIAFMQLDESRTRDYWLPDNRGQYPEFTRFRYPKAGETNAEIRAGVVEVASGNVTFFDTDTWYAGGNEHEYLPLIGWTPPIDGQARVWLVRLNRNQSNLDLIYGDPRDGSTLIALSETEPTYIDVETGFSAFDIGKITFLNDEEHFVWTSETDGFKHLYLHNNTGERVARLTEGDWQVTGFHGVDEMAGYVYFSATIEHPTQRHLYRISFDLANGGYGVPERITVDPGWHSASLSNDLKFFIDDYSNASTPPTQTLRSIDGESLVVLEDNATLRNTLSNFRIPELEFIQVPGADGISLNAYMIKPSDFDESDSYPLLIFVYGGPGSQRVVDDWNLPMNLFHRYVVDANDIVVVCIDARGTGARGKAFQAATYGKLGIVEAQDLQAAAEHLGSLPYLEASRIGIWGWSYGAFASLMSMFTGSGPELFSLGVAVSPVTDWRQYDTIYTERYLSTPQENPEGYRIGSPITYVHRMSNDQQLLITHGDMDDNVHFQNSVQLIDALQRAGKQFRFMLYPGKDHGINGGRTQHHIFTMISNFIAENL